MFQHYLRLAPGSRLIRWSVFAVANAQFRGCGMTVRLVSQVNGDSDLIESWLKYYIGLGVASFHLIAHGSNSDNSRLFSIKDKFPIFIVDAYDSEYSVEEKKRRIDSVLATMTDQWLL